MKSHVKKLQEKTETTEKRNKSINLLYNEMEKDFTDLLEKKDSCEKTHVEFLKQKHELKLLTSELANKTTEVQSQAQKIVYQESNFEQ